MKKMYFPFYRDKIKNQGHTMISRKGIDNLFKLYRVVDSFLVELQEVNSSQKHSNSIQNVLMTIVLKEPGLVVSSMVFPVK